MKQPAWRSSATAAVIRLLSVLLRCLLLIASATAYELPALHFATVAHEICPEHGQLRHGEAQLGPRTIAARTTLEISSAPRLEHEHEHCSVLATQAVGAGPAEPRAVLLTPTQSQTQTRIAQSAAEITVALLDYAPKLAPPA